MPDDDQGTDPVGHLMDRLSDLTPRERNSEELADLHFRGTEAGFWSGITFSVYLFTHNGTR